MSTCPTTKVNVCPKRAVRFLPSPSVMSPHKSPPKGAPKLVRLETQEASTSVINKSASVSFWGNDDWFLFSRPGRAGLMKSRSGHCHNLIPSNLARGKYICIEPDNLEVFIPSVLTIAAKPYHRWVKVKPFPNRARFAVFCSSPL